MFSLPYDEGFETLLLPMDGCHNFRRVSGWQSQDGRTIRPDFLYRADGLNQLSDADQARLIALGIRRVFDLRATAEKERAPSRWPERMALTLWAEAESAAEADLTAMMQRQGLRAGDFRAAMCQVYARFPYDLANAVKALADAILSADKAAAVLVHCTAGKDRTGFVVAMLLHSVGIAPEQVMADYLLSNANFESAVTKFGADGRFDALPPGTIANLVGVHPDYLHASEQRIINDFGAFDNWLETQAGIDAAKRDLLKMRLLG